MPSSDRPGRWSGWWEGVVDLVPVQGGNRAFSINSLFKKGLPRPFPEADESILKIIMPEEGGLMMEPWSEREERLWIDGKSREVREWVLQSGNLAGKDVQFRWEGEEDFQHRGCH